MDILEILDTVHKPSIIPALRRWKQDQEFRDILGYNPGEFEAALGYMRLCLRKSISNANKSLNQSQHRQKKVK